MLALSFQFIEEANNLFIVNQYILRQNELTFETMVSRFLEKAPCIQDGKNLS